MDSQNVVVGRGSGREDIVAVRDSALQKRFVNQAIFLRWEYVIAEVQVVAMIID